MKSLSESKKVSRIPDEDVCETNSDRTIILEVHNVQKSFGSIQVLNDVSFKVPEGNVYSFIGTSGSGKSTLLRCINFLNRADSGRIVWRGSQIGWKTKGGKSVPVSETDLLPYRTEVGMVFQSFNLFPNKTAFGNIIEAPILQRSRPREEIEQHAEQLLEKVQLSHRANSYPHQLSGGEQQRVAIARALAMQPRALLLDEVTSALDPELKGEVLSVIRDLAKEGLTMLLVSHEMGFVRQISDRVHFMYRGVIHEEGTSSEIFGNPQSSELMAFLRSIHD